jgi:hypothetical protein
MPIIFDQATPVPIRPYLDGHTVRTAAQHGWDKLRNGDLLTVAEAAGFDVLLTTDKNMRHQQNLAGRKIAIVVLGQQQWPRLRSTFGSSLKLSMRPHPAAMPRFTYRSSKLLPAPSREFDPPTGGDWGLGSRSTQKLFASRRMTALTVFHKR